MRNHEYLAVWLEGVALLAILGFDIWARTEEAEESRKERRILRRQTHADRASQILTVLRKFLDTVWLRVHVLNTFNAGMDFSETGDVGRGGIDSIWPEYLELQQAYYSSYFISDKMAAFMKERMAEADALQRVRDPEDFQTRLNLFRDNWDVYKLGTAMRNLF